VSVHRLIHKNSPDPYTRVPNAAINSLEPKQLGVYVFMLSKPDNWRFREATIGAQMGVSRAQIRTAIAGLMAAGWVTRHKVLEHGKPVTLTAVWDTNTHDSDEGTENERTESVPVSNERESKKADEDGGVATPLTDSGDSDGEPGPELSSERWASKSSVLSSERSITDSSYAARLLDELGDAAPDLHDERLADNYLALFDAARAAGKKPEPVAIGLTLGLLVKTFGPLPENARGLVARLVKANGPTAVMHGAVTTVGSTVGSDVRYAEDPLGPVRYLSGVVRGRK
jgi:hypothetical protein